MGTRVRKQPKAKRKSRRKAARRSVLDVTIPPIPLNRGLPVNPVTDAQKLKAKRKRIPKKKRK